MDMKQSNNGSSDSKKQDSQQPKQQQMLNDCCQQHNNKTTCSKSSQNSICESSLNNPTCNAPNTDTNNQAGCQQSTSSSTISTQTPKRQGLINVPLIPLKIILFSWYAAGACLLPYMTLHMKQLGLTMVEMTAVYAILPIIQLLGTPLAGFMADKTGNYKSVLLMTLSTCIITTLLIQHVVPARKPRDPNAPLAGSAGSGAGEDENVANTLYMLTFWIYLLIRIFHQVAVGLTYVLLDTTTIVLAEQNNSNYGRQRFWAILATGVFSPICGYIIDHISYNVDEYGSKIKNFDPAFHFFNALTLLTLIKASMIDVQISSIPTNVWGNVRPLLRSPNVWIFLFSVFMMGSCWGFLESFLFIHLDKLGAPNYLLGLTVTVGAFIGLPFLYGSEWFVKKFGAVQLLIVALVVYFIRLIGYSLLDNPWYCIPYELMEAFTLHLMWVATVGLAYQISPPGMLATLQAVVGGLNFGVGRGFGSLVGGAVLVVYGIRTAFQVIGCMALGTAVLYAILHFYFLPPIEVHETKKDLSPVGANGTKKFSLDRNDPHMSSSRRRRQESKDIESGGPKLISAAAS